MLWCNTHPRVGVAGMKAALDGAGHGQRPRDRVGSVVGRPKADPTHYFLLCTFQSQVSHVTRAFCVGCGQFWCAKRRYQPPRNAEIDGNLPSTTQEKFDAVQNPVNCCCKPCNLRLQR